MANAVTYAGMAWDGQIHQCQLYDRACRIKQCFRCYHYGHITTQCNASQVRGYCAELHETKHCRRKEVEGFTPRCTVCKEDHTAWSNACPARRKEMKRVEQAKEVRNVYWHVPPRDGPAPSARHITRDTDTRQVDAREVDTRTRPPSTSQTFGDAITHPESRPTLNGTPPSELIQLPAGAAGTLEATIVQILVTPPAGEENEGEGPIPEPSLEHVEITEGPLHQMGNTGESPSVYPDLGLEGIFTQEAEQWLANLAENHDDNNWLNAATENPEIEPTAHPLFFFTPPPQTKTKKKPKKKKKPRILTTAVDKECRFRGSVHG